MSLKLHWEPAVIKAHIVNPRLGCLFRVELSGKEWVIRAFHRCNKWSTIFCITESINFKHILQTLVSLKCVRMNPFPMMVVSQVVFFKKLSIFSKRFIHFWCFGIFCKLKRKAHFIGSYIGQDRFFITASIRSHEFKAETCPPQWIKSSIIIVLNQSVIDELTQLVIISPTTW